MVQYGHFEGPNVSVLEEKTGNLSNGPYITHNRGVLWS